MKTSFWTPYISDHTINAICWTLIHSIWIGLAVALLSGLVITFTSKSSAALRYRLLCGILLLFVASAGITFYLEMQSAGTEQLHGGTNLILVGNMSAGPVDHVTPVSHTNLFAEFVSLVKQNTNIIFMIWLTGIGLYINIDSAARFDDYVVVAPRRNGYVISMA